MEQDKNVLRPVFVVGMAQQAETIRAAGFEAVTYTGEEWDAWLLSECRRRQVVLGLILNPEDVAKLREDVRPYGLLTWEPEASARNKAFTEGGEALGLFLKQQAQGGADLALNSTMRRMHVGDAADAVLNVISLDGCGDPIPTGIAQIDEMLDGGLPHMGLAVLGAQSSYGKTTLALQIADHVAESGRPVLFVTIEQGERELVCKSLSRRMAQVNGMRKSAAELITPKKRASWSDSETGALNAAGCWYVSDVSRQIRFQTAENGIRPSVADVAEAAEAMRWRFGVAPLIVVDYLQLLAPPEQESGGRPMGDKEAADANVTALRHLSRKLDTCILAVSSISRGSYKTGASLSALKESGGIEYGADVVLFITGNGEEQARTQATSEKGREQDIRQADSTYRAQAKRDALVWVIKNRNGVGHDSRHITYNADVNLFESRSGATKAAAPNITVY